MSKFLILFLVLFLCFGPSFGIFFSSNALASNSAHRGGAELLNQKAYSFKAQASLFSSTAIYDQDGIERSMLDGDSFKMVDSDFKISYGLSSKLETSLFFKWRSIKAVSQSVAVTNSGPESVGVEGKYAFEPMGKVTYAFGVHYYQTLYTNTVYPTQAAVPVDSIILGDDGSEYGVSLFATYNNQPWKFDSAITYVAPPNDLSSEIQYKFEGLYFFSKISIGGGVEGIYSLERNQLDQKPWMARGPSNLFNSLNRQYVAPYIGVNYAFNNSLLSLKGESVISGRSTDKGNLIALGITWNSDGVTPEFEKINSFKEYHIEGSVLKVSARGNFVKIDQGLTTDVEKGAKFDIYQTDYFGGNILVASGVVFNVGTDWAVIKVLKKYKEIDIKPGFAARGQ